MTVPAVAVPFTVALAVPVRMPARACTVSVCVPGDTAPRPNVSVAPATVTAGSANATGAGASDPLASKLALPGTAANPEGRVRTTETVGVALATVIVVVNVAGATRGEPRFCSGVASRLMSCHGRSASANSAGNRSASVKPARGDPASKRNRSASSMGGVAAVIARLAAVSRSPTCALAVVPSNARINVARVAVDKMPPGVVAA